MRLLLLPAWLIDGISNAPREGIGVVIAGDRIEAVDHAEELAAMPGLTTIRLPNSTLLPGLINHHVHLNLPGDNTPMTPWIDGQSDAALALRSAANAAASLSAGTTTVRDCGGRGTTVLDTRDALKNGLVGGAAIVSCGWPITITGGHTRHMGGEADGADALRRMVRHLVSLGADYIKVMAAGGGTPGSLAQRPSFSTAELTAIVETAHDLGRKVAMHCIATASISRAITAGTDLIEHAMFYSPDLTPRLDEQVAEQLAASGIPVTPTLQVAKDVLDLQSPTDDLALWAQRRETGLGIVARLRELGVPLLAGSDAGWRATAFDTFWKELAELVAAGLTPVEAIGSATSGNARALGLGEETGAIRPDLRADVLAVEGNVAEDIARLQHVTLVIQGGKQTTPVGPLPVA